MAVENIDISTSIEVDPTTEYVEKEVNRSKDFPMDLVETVVFIFCFLFEPFNLDGT
jgi:hypothetical protein